MSDIKKDEVMDLVGGYEAYADADELDDGAESGAPESTPVCGAITVSFVASQFSAKTYEEGC